MHRFSALKKGQLVWLFCGGHAEDVNLPSMVQDELTWLRFLSKRSNEPTDIELRGLTVASINSRIMFAMRDYAQSGGRLSFRMLLNAHGAPVDYSVELEDFATWQTTPEYKAIEVEVLTELRKLQDLRAAELREMVAEAKARDEREARAREAKRAARFDRDKLRREANKEPTASRQAPRHHPFSPLEGSGNDWREQP